MAYLAMCNMISPFAPIPPLRGKDYAYVPICRHMSPYVTVCPNWVTEIITHLSKHISKMLQNPCFQAESTRVLFLIVANTRKAAVSYQKKHS